MNALIVYDSQFGNTERIAQTLADALKPFGQARAARVDPANVQAMQGIDLLLLGSPTQGWRPTLAMQAWLDNVPDGILNGISAASFDTRFRRPRWLTGSAARGMARKLHRMDCLLLLPPESFFVHGKAGPLLDGELERAANWAHTLGEKYVRTVKPIPMRQIGYKL